MGTSKGSHPSDKGGVYSQKISRTASYLRTPAGIGAVRSSQGQFATSLPKPVWVLPSLQPSQHIVLAVHITVNYRPILVRHPPTYHGPRLKSKMMGISTWIEWRITGESILTSQAPAGRLKIQRRK